MILDGNNDTEHGKKWADNGQPSSILPNGNKTNWQTELKDWLKTISIAFGIMLILHLFVFNLSKVEGHSMEPTLKEKEWLFVNKIVYLVSEPKFGDVVILKQPGTLSSEKKFLVKRVVGVPGDKIEVHDKHLYRNGNMVEEPYTDSLIEDLSYGPEVVLAGHYFVMGDNRHARASLDSRSFQAVADEMIRGRADFILWPFKEIRSLN